MSNPTQEKSFQNDIIQHLQANGWQLGKSQNYNRKLALYEEDVLAFIEKTQPKEWQKYCKLYPDNPKQKLLERITSQLDKADPHAATKEMRTFGTLGVLRHLVRDRGVRFCLCQFKPEHDLNPDTQARYQKNRFRVVPELVYSPWLGSEESDASQQTKAYRIDLVLFVNGLPIVTLELKSEFKQALQKAKEQYQKTRLPIDPNSKKAEPLLTFKRGALVHFAVSQYEVAMTTHLAGDSTVFLPFNKGTKDGGAGNDVPQDITCYATDYLWNEVLVPDNLINILARFVHLQIEETEDWEGRKSKQETLIFPRYHQWDVVTKLLAATRHEGPGHKYLIQHSAGSGKSNSIAWVAHQLSAVHNAEGIKQFQSVIIITDRSVLDEQLQDTISQFEHVDGVVCRINRKEGEGSKSEKLAAALERAQPIIVVTIQTFPFVLKAIENSAVLKKYNYAIIADEAHSSQTGTTAKGLGKMLRSGKDKDAPAEIEDIIVSAKNLSYFAFTATPKSKTIELFGRVPNPELVPSKSNLPQSFHIYSMRQAIEEGFILDVLRNYTNYKTMYQLTLKDARYDETVDSKRAQAKLKQWVRLHDYNISQRVTVIVEHFKEHVIQMIAGQAKAMVVTSSRKEAVRYKLGFDAYIKEKKYSNIHAMVAFSGEVIFNENDPNAEKLLKKKFNEKNMNSKLKGRDMRKAFDSDDYQVMIVANKFQTGFDQPKLCAMYVDKKLRSVDCVQTLSRLNRIYPGKTKTYILDLCSDNAPEDILAAFQPYFQTAQLDDVSDPDRVYDLFDKLRSAGIFQWHEVQQFHNAFLQKSKSNAAIANICKPAVERWNIRITNATNTHNTAKDLYERIKKETTDTILITNAENQMKQSKKDKNFLEIFKKDLGTYPRFYEFMSQIVNYNDQELEKLSLYARYLHPMLRETITTPEIDLNNIQLSHYRLSQLRHQDLILKENTPEYNLKPGDERGTAKAKNKKEAFLSQIIERLNELFVTDELTDNDLVNYAYAIRDKVKENKVVMLQIANNNSEQAMLGAFPQAIDNAVMDSSEAHQNQMMQLLSDRSKAQGFAKIVFDLLKKII